MTTGLLLLDPPHAAALERAVHYAKQSHAPSRAPVYLIVAVYIAELWPPLAADWPASARRTSWPATRA